MHEILSTVRDGLARTRAPGPRAAQLSLCTPEKLVSPDVLAVPSRYPTAFPAVPSWYCTEPDSGEHASIPYSLLNFAAQAPTKLSFEREAEP